MIIPKEMSLILTLIGNGMIWLYIAIFFILSYLFISLLTWSFIKPLKYLGIPTIIVGILLLVIRLSSSILLNFASVTSQSELGIIKTLLPSVLKPMVLYGVISFFIGVIMIVLYILINKKRKPLQLQS